MISIVKSIAILMGVFLFAPSSYSSPQEKLLPEGKLIFANGWGIRELNVQTGELKTLYGDPNITQATFGQNALSKINEDSFLFDIDGIGQKEEIRLFDRKSNTHKFLRAGMRPVYIPGHRKFLFLYNDPSSVPRGPRLYVADIDDPINSATRLMDDVYQRYQGIFQVTRDEVLIDRDDNFLRYNVKTAKHTELPKKQSCEPRIWRIRTKHLLCAGATDHQYFWMGLDGRNAGTAKGGTLILSYIHEYDLLIGLGAYVENMAEKYDIKAYSFKEDREELIKKKEYLLSVIWFRQ